MCEPVTIAATALTAASEGLKIAGQRAANKAEARYQREMVDNINSVARSNMDRLGLRISQTIESSAAEEIRAQREAARAAAAAAVAAAESGLGSNTADIISADYKMQEGLYRAAIKKQLEMDTSQLIGQQHAVAEQAKYDALRVNKPISPPNYLGAILNTASAGLNAYAMSKR